MKLFQTIIEGRNVHHIITIAEDKDDAIQKIMKKYFYLNFKFSEIVEKTDEVESGITHIVA